MKREEKVSLWINHNNLLWSRFQTASVIEGGALAGAYQIHESHKYWAFILMLLAAFLPFGLLLIMSRDVLHIDAFRKLNDDEPMPPVDDKPIWRPICDANDKLHCEKWGKFKGRDVGLLMIGVLVIFNMAASLVFLGIHSHCPSSN
jgi:hypothetical protein